MGLLTALARRDQIERERDQSAPAMPAQPAPPSSVYRPERYIATDLDWWETCAPGPDQDGLCERCGYRRLDPPYFAWLREIPVRARDAHAHGELPAEVYGHLRGRFNELQDWARVRFGEPTLVAAVAAFRSGSYRPPEVWLPEPQHPDDPSWLHRFPAGGDWLFQEPVSAAALAKADAIRDRAVALGWGEPDLYQNRSNLLWPHGHDWGLVALLGPGDVVGEITREGIEIRRETGAQEVFANRRRGHARAACLPGLGEGAIGS